MKLAIERAALLKALAHVQSVVERRNTIPILANVLSRRASRLWPDRDRHGLAIVERTGRRSRQPGTTTAPAHTLYDIVRKLPEGSQVGIEQRLQRQRAGLRAGRSTLRSALPAGRGLPDDDRTTSLPHSFKHPGRRTCAG